MGLNIVKHDASFKMADSLSPTIRKVFNDSQNKSPNRMHPDAKKQSVLLMERYAHISSKIKIKRMFNDGDISQHQKNKF